VKDEKSGGVVGKHKHTRVTRQGRMALAGVNVQNTVKH